MKSQGVPDFQAPPPILTLIDTAEAVNEMPSHDSPSFVPTRSGGTVLTQLLMSSRLHFLGDGMTVVYLNGCFPRPDVFAIAT
jgi:hypothetical protein